MSRVHRGGRASLCVLCFLGVFCARPLGITVAAAQEPTSPQPVSAAQLKTAIDNLGKLDYAVRANASRVVRRTPVAQAVPALLQAVAEHADGYVRYRALVLLTAFNDPRTRDSMREALASPNDRLRAVAYSFFEHNPDRALLQQFLTALDKEQGQFVRPSLVRALAALAVPAGEDSTRVRQALLREVARGEDFFRSAVIEALGDYKAYYATKAISGVARLEGPLQDDAALALGKIGDKSQMALLAGLQQTAPRETQPAVAAAICLLGSNCDVHRGYLVKILAFTDKIPGYQELLRGAAAGLAALAERGDGEALSALVDAGIPAQDTTRAPIALALASVAVKAPAVMLAAFETRTDRTAAVELLRDGFDMLEEDFAEEGFYVTIRRAYWAANEGSATRATAQEIIQKLEF